MKNLLTFPFLFLFFHYSFSQDWALFPEGQKTYWEADGQFHLYYNDVTFPGGFTNKHYFGADYLTKYDTTECYNEILMYEYQLNEPPIDSIFSTPFYWFDFLGNDQIYFYQLTEPGGSWTNITSSIAGIDSIVFSCISKNEEMFLGVTDSVKSFTLKGFKNDSVISDFNDIEYKLSKNNGLLKFVPLRSLGSQMVEYEMIGFDDGQEHGFTNSWKNYFGEFEPGMIMKWWDIKNGAYTPPGFYIEETFYIDSIISVNFTDSQVSLYVERYGTRYFWKSGNLYSSPWDSISTFSENKYVSHWRHNYDLTLDAAPGWFNISHDNEKVTYYSQHNFSNWELPTISYDDFNYRYDSASTECVKLIADPAYIHNVLTRGLGITDSGIIGGFWFLHFETKLLGYGLNGEYFGDVVNPVFSRPVPNLSFKLFPNPTADELNIVFPDELNLQKMELKITDITGNIISSKNAGNGIKKMDVSSFPSGIYFIVVSGDGVWGRERFVKN